MLTFNMETRSFSEGLLYRMEKEGEIYALLESKCVPNIAPFGKGNDVCNHMCLPHLLRNEKWARWSRDSVLVGQLRMSLDVVASPLTSVGSREFGGAIADAMEGKTSFAGLCQMIEPLFMQLIYVPTSALMFSIDIQCG
jgi:hypothetical protein